MVILIFIFRKKKSKHANACQTIQEDLIEVYHSPRNINTSSNTTDDQESVIEAIDDEADIVEDILMDGVNEQIPLYSFYNNHAKAHLEFKKKFKHDSFGHSCAVCDRLWWKNDLKDNSQNHENILNNILPVSI